MNEPKYRNNANTPLSKNFTMIRRNTTVFARSFAVHLKCLTLHTFVGAQQRKFIAFLNMGAWFFMPKVSALKMTWSNSIFPFILPSSPTWINSCEWGTPDLRPRQAADSLSSFFLRIISGIEVPIGPYVRTTSALPSRKVARKVIKIVTGCHNDNISLQF